jgi:molybdopterin-binding protein
MEISARNQLRGTVQSVTMGDIMAEVVIDLGGQLITAEITRKSAERLGLKIGTPAIAIIKATEVMVGKE